MVHFCCLRCYFFKSLYIFSLSSIKKFWFVTTPFNKTKAAIKEEIAMFRKQFFKDIKWNLK